MKSRSVKTFFRSRYPLAIIAGFLLACAFPNFGVAGLGWVAPGLILLAALGTGGKQSFRIGYAAGVTHYLVSLYWLLCIPVRGFPILGWIALSAFLGLYPAVWTWLATKWLSGNPDRQAPKSEDADASAIAEGMPAGKSRIFGADIARRFSLIASRSWIQRTLWAASCAALWVALEMLVARFLGGFPWNLLGASQYRIVPLIQITAVTGVYGLTFLLVWSSASLLNAVGVMMQSRQPRSVWVKEMALPLLTVAIAFAAGFHQVRQADGPVETVRVTLVQPSIPQTMIWNEAGNTERFETLIQLSEAALSNQTDVLIWPEAAIPKMLRYNADIREPILNLARSHGVWMIVGSDDAEPRKGSADSEEAEYFNSSFLISPAGNLVERYRKRNLVIFGEYIPLVRWLPFIKWFTPVTGSFTPGDKAVTFEMNLAADVPEPSSSVTGNTNAPPSVSARARRVKTSVLICYEDNFPHLVREYVEDDTDFLVNLTNNGWFGESAAQWQHAANAIFRAVENGLPLVRCSNNGLTCWVDAQGRIREFFRDDAGTIYGAGFLQTEIPRLTAPRTQTFYRRHGDVFGWSCVAWAASAILRSRSWKRLPAKA